MDIIKDLLYFDDSNYKLKGGAPLVAAQVAKSGVASNVASNAASNSSGNNNSNNNNKDLEKVNESSLFGDFGDSIIETVRDTFKKFKSFILGYFIIPVMFGSFAPALPFFVVMAAMFAILKYLMGFFRKL
jgi:hypothetical protein